MHGRYVTDILKMCMKNFNAEKRQIYKVFICTLPGGGGGGGGWRKGGIL